jgi:large subunit ribosomal protein L28
MCAFRSKRKEVYTMAKCDICQKDMFFGRKISITRSQVSRRALVRQKPNVRQVRVVVDGTPKTMHVCTRCLRSNAVKRA